MPDTATEVTSILTVIPIDQLHPHPDNPRIGFREDVLESLTTQMTKGLAHEHALIVRPLNGAFQIVSGHHRREAAVRIGLTELPCWVREMTDDEAFMQLVLGNTQGELSPLEYGLHALKAVPTEQGKSGGGLSAYAERIGKSQPYVSQLRDAAEVFASLHCPSNEVKDKPKHLYEISKADPTHWGTMVEDLITNQWTVIQVRDQVKQLREQELAKLAEAERIQAEEADAKTFIDANAPDLAATVHTLRGQFTDDELLHATLTRSLRENGGSPEGAITLLGKVAAEENWRRLPDHHFGSFTAYVTASTGSGGLGMNTKDVETILNVRTEIERQTGPNGVDA